MAEDGIGMYNPAVFQGGAGGSSPSAGNYKTVMCKYFATGTCTKGDACTFSHGQMDDMAGMGGGKAGMGGKGNPQMMAMLAAMMGGSGLPGMKGKGKGDGKGKVAGHTLPRQRITETPIIGEVLEWLGKYGWVKPNEPIEHEKAGKHGGKIFVGRDDLLGGMSELTPGRLCQFHVFVDASGLGGEEVLQA
eukprot:CAMPEP_0197628938 /NCGR_PEP_ID=MMETSP1338-20131121/7015_1 /TAXON_ID=43686 ORGANISM="Pelagodinium beii, Strain RCC1491" /NCGR_SAMPLE_ID=MMETSP1338 /ASSEMBLY_ACC=CAM_ASM_000754 /LENGTH=189 /DNA_ID=CAMNT_0043199941 /DNA_START=1 /DNA_END=570 /DNA_ORIENTATION=-